jgi:type IV pilus assembly protein PilW
MNRLAFRGGQRGLTLIEMMVSIAIGLVVVGAVTYTYVGSKGSYRGNESMARVQEAGRFALDSITRDVRRAGALGCGSLASITPGQPVSITVAAPVTLTVGPANAIQGFALGSGWTAPAGVPTYFAGDVVQLQVATGVPARVTTTPDTTGGTIAIADNTVNGAVNFKAGDYALLANCSAATVLAIATSPGAVKPATLGFANGGTVPAIASSPGVFAATTYPTLQHFDQVTYYVGTVPLSTRSALYRYSAQTGQAEEVVENIEDMDVVYGVDTFGTNTAGTFVHATGVADWTKVVSVRISLVAVGDQLGTAPPNQVLLFRGPDPNPTPAASVAPDTRLRQVFAASAALRDRLQVQ